MNPHFFHLNVGKICDFFFIINQFHYQKNIKIQTRVPLSFWNLEARTLTKYDVVSKNIFPQFRLIFYELFLH